MSGEPAFVVLLRVHLHFPDVGSLKAKRAELNRVKAHLRERCGASVAEVGAPGHLAALDARGRARRPARRGRCDEAADASCALLDARFPQGVRVERRVASWDDLEALG